MKLMKLVLVWVSLMGVVTSCVFPPPDRHALYVFNTDDAIKQAFESIRQKEHYADDFDYDAAEAVHVVFADGSLGAFVAFEVAGPARGYQVLMQANGGLLTVLEQRNTAPNGWGRRMTGWGDTIHTPMTHITMTLEVGQPEQALLKVNGRGHLGTGSFDNDTFEFIDVRDKHIRVLFRGADASESINPGGWSETYWHRFVQDEQKPIQIYVDATKCIYKWHGKDYVKDDCRTETIAYSYNGVEFVDELGEPSGYGTTKFMKTEVKP